MYISSFIFELSGYFPTAAIYTMPLQEHHHRAKVTFNFGPDFAYPIEAEKNGLPACRGFSPDLDPPKPPIEENNETSIDTSSKEEKKDLLTSSDERATMICKTQKKQKGMPP